MRLIYTSATPNGWKIKIALEELQVPYIYNVDLSAGDSTVYNLALNSMDEFQLSSTDMKITSWFLNRELFCYIWQRRPENLCRRIRQKSSYAMVNVSDGGIDPCRGSCCFRTLFSRRCAG